MFCPVDSGRGESESVSLLLRSNEIITFDLLTFLDLGFNCLLAIRGEIIALARCSGGVQKNLYLYRQITHSDKMTS